MRAEQPGSDLKLGLRQGHRLLQLGVGLFLLASLQGLVIQSFAVPSLGRSVHTLAIVTGLLLVALGVVWPRLGLHAVALRLAYWSLVYSSLITIVAFLLAAIWGAGKSFLPLAAGSAHGSTGQEAIIGIALVSAAPTGIISFALILWGLMSGPAGVDGSR
jgi:(hydroxyamino)benzene mutase